MIMKLLDISTLHITPHTMKRLEGVDTTLGLVIYPIFYGAIVHLTDDQETIDDLPGDLKAVVNYAMDLECEWIKFDGDGDVILELKRYDNEWEGD